MIRIIEIAAAFMSSHHIMGATRASTGTAVVVFGGEG
jgi:hypothetical protein